MGKKISIGVSGTAHKGKKILVGGTDGKARKGKKAWIGDANGKARLFWSGFEPFTLAGVTYSNQFELYKSTDFNTFSKVLGKTGDYGTLVSVDYAEGKYFCLCANYPNVNILVTEDGETYTVGIINTGYKISNGSLYTWLIFANNKYYFAFCNPNTKKVTIYSSSDAQVWTKLSEVSISDTSTYISPLVYGYGVADSTKKKFYLYNMSSDDCITWESCYTRVSYTLGGDGYIYSMSGTDTSNTQYIYKGASSSAICKLSGAPSSRTLYIGVQSPFNDNEFLSTITYAGSTKLYKINKTSGVVTDLSFEIGEEFNKKYMYRPAKKICSALILSSVTYTRFRYLSSESAWTYFTNITGISGASSNMYTIVHD